MQITDHVYSTHIAEDPNTYGAMHPGGTQIYFVGDPAGHMVMNRFGRTVPRLAPSDCSLLGRVGSPHHRRHPDYSRPTATTSGGWTGCRSYSIAPVRCHPKLAPRLQHTLGGDSVVALSARESIATGGDATLRPLFTPGTRGRPRVLLPAARTRAIQRRQTCWGNSSSSVRNLKTVHVLAEPHGQHSPAGPSAPATATPSFGASRAYCSRLPTGRVERTRCSPQSPAEHPPLTQLWPPSTRATSASRCAMPPAATCALTWRNYDRRAASREQEAKYFLAA